ncbi:MAG: rhodanese-like domain-containing protein [Candidatus Alcyoniella australis]|nr:rhodanese-like domain-containing protein [Candidatus Alcyoniella australis]
MCASYCAKTTRRAGARRAWSKPLSPAAIVRDALLIVLISAALALGFNGLREHSLPLVADHEYQVFVPCPEPVGQAEPLDAAQVDARPGHNLLVDARTPEDFAAWHPEGALNVPFDWLEPVPEQDLEKLARSRAQRIVVFGNGAEPDSGRELARELSGAGLKNVYFVRHGAPALRAADQGRDDG